MTAPRLTLLSLALTAALALGEGFSEPDIVFYGQVRKIGGTGASLLQSGTLDLTLTNRSDPTNQVHLTTTLRPTGQADPKPFSYALRVPLHYLPRPDQKSTGASVSSTATNFGITSIAIDGQPATLPDASLEFFPLSAAARASQHRLDLIVQGDSTDTDADGIPDWWETLHALDPGRAADAALDPDNDGWSNLAEFRNGADPRVSNLTPALLTTELSAPEHGEAGVLLHFLTSSPADIPVTVAPVAPTTGFTLNLDGTPLATAEPLTLADLQSGRLTLAAAPSATTATLPLSWPDGSAEITLRSHAPGAGATLWLDGAQLPAGGQPIDHWPDRSGHARHAMQPLAGYQPTARDHAADFSDSSSHLFFHDTAFPVGDHTVLAAYAAPPSTGDQTLLSSNRGFLHLTSSTAPVSYPGTPHYQIDGLAVHGFAELTNSTNTSVFRRHGPLLQHVTGLSYDGESTDASPLDPVIPTIGARRSASGQLSTPFAGQLHELLVFPAALAEQELRDAHDYLQSKWHHHVIWDTSTSLKPVTLTGSPQRPNTIRGGLGDDNLTGGDLADIISGGPGADRLTGGPGPDHFVFGAVDTGADTITDFDPEVDTIDLSALFWGQSGDVRTRISTRLDTNFSTPVPTLDTTLIVSRPNGTTQHILLRDTTVGTAEFTQLVVEGRLRTGALTVPADVTLAAAPGTPPTIREHKADSFQVTLQRSGPGTAAALDVPVGFFQDALGTDFAVTGDTPGTRRATVSFARGETSKTLTVHAVPDLETEGEEIWETRLLPQFRYTSTSPPITQRVSDVPKVWVEIVEPVALPTRSRPASIVLHRDGSLAGSLTLFLGSSNPTLAPVAANLTIPAGSPTITVSISPEPSALTADSALATVRIAPADNYLLASPSLAVITIATSEDAAGETGFERWLVDASTYQDLAAVPPHQLKRLLATYASRHLTLDFDLVEHHPALTLTGPQPADLSWQVFESATLRAWQPATHFVANASPNELTFTGEPGAPRHFKLSPALTHHSLDAETLLQRLASPTGTSALSGDWQSDPATGHLTTAGPESSAILSVSGTTQLDFQMLATGSSTMTFYIDGVPHATAPAHVTETLEGDHLLMWKSNGQSTLSP